MYQSHSLTPFPDYMVSKDYMQRKHNLAGFAVILFYSFVLR